METLDEVIERHALNAEMGAVAHQLKQERQTMRGSRQNDQAVPKVQFRKWDCRVEFEKYTNGRTGLVLRNAKDGEEVAVATVNVPGAQLGPKEVLIKDYSENEGMLAALERVGIVRRTGRSVESGFATIPVCELLISPPEKEKDRTKSLSELKQDGSKAGPRGRTRQTGIER